MKWILIVIAGITTLFEVVVVIGVLFKIITADLIAPGTLLSGAIYGFLTLVIGLFYSFKKRDSSEGKDRDAQGQQILAEKSK